MNGRGFLGTDASLTADLSLVFGLAVATLLTIGVLLARQRRIGAHRTVQSLAVALNVLQVTVVMVGSFAKSVAPGLRDQLGDSYIAIAAGHGILGTVTLLFGVFVALRANELVPGFLRFHNYKLFMRTAYGLYMAATLAGVALYANWYIDFSPTPTPRGEAQPAIAEQVAAVPTSVPVQVFVVTATPLPTPGPGHPDPRPNARAARHRRLARRHAVQRRAVRLCRRSARRWQVRRVADRQWWQPVPGPARPAPG